MTALPNPLRRALLLTAGATALGGARAANPPQPPFALTPPGRVAPPASSLAGAPALQLLAQAKSALARQPHPMPLVRTSGLLDGEGIRAESQQAQEDWRQVRLQALAYRLSGDAAHFNSAQRYLAAWIGSYTPSFNPIDETELAAMLFGVDLIQSELPPPLLADTRAWCRTLANGYLAKKIINGGKLTGVNNWHSHRMKLGSAGAFLHGDPALIEQAREEFALQVLRNLDADGKAFDFTQRDALHYVVFTLEPLLTCASMAAAHGMDWYRMAGIEGRLAKALDWLLPYASGARTHEEFVRSSVDFDRRRAATGVKGFAGTWRRENAATVYWLAARLDPAYRQISAELGAPPLVQLLHAQTFY